MEFIKKVGQTISAIVQFINLFKKFWAKDLVDRFKEIWKK